MKLIEDTIENLTVTIEIDENEDHHKWRGCPSIICEKERYLFESCDVLTVIKAVKTSETVEEFISKVNGDKTWKKEKLALPILRTLNKKSIAKINENVIEILNYSFTDENKELFEFDDTDRDCLNSCLKHYANIYNGRFDKLTENEQVKYLVQSALADC